ncbi:sulfatase-like hydrolase/transferase [Streptomyces sp. NPDC001617]
MSEIHRQILPIPDVTRPGSITYDAKDPDTSFPPIRPLMPPEQAPNVMLIMLDDVGFGAPSTFGGPCETPVFDRLARNGLRDTRFHSTALCSPDAGTPVALDYESPDGAFTGDIHRVQVDTGPNDADHLIRPEDRIRIAMGRQ